MNTALLYPTCYGRTFKGRAFAPGANSSPPERVYSQDWSVGLAFGWQGRVGGQRSMTWRWGYFSYRHIGEFVS